MSNKRDWTPRLSGSIFCSPACGGKCTKSAYDKAQRKAAALCDRLGPGWTPRVHENLGWHYSAINGEMSIREDGYLGNSPGDYGLLSGPGPQIVMHGTDPHELLRNGLKQLRKNLADQQKRVDAMIEIVKEIPTKKRTKS